MRLVTLLFFVLLSATAGAQDAERLTREQLLEFLPGTKVVHVAKSSGSTRSWTNEADGKLYASSDNRLYPECFINPQPDANVMIFWP